MDYYNWTFSHVQFAFYEQQLKLQTFNQEQTTFCTLSFCKTWCQLLVCLPYNIILITSKSIFNARLMLILVLHSTVKCSELIMLNINQSVKFISLIVNLLNLSTASKFMTWIKHITNLSKLLGLSSWIKKVIVIILYERKNNNYYTKYTCFKIIHVYCKLL